MDNPTAIPLKFGLNLLQGCTDVSVGSSPYHSKVNTIRRRELEFSNFCHFVHIQYNRIAKNDSTNGASGRFIFVEIIRVDLRSVCFFLWPDISRQ